MYRKVNNITRQLLQELYVDEQWTLRDIASYIGCSIDTVGRRMVMYGIPRRSTKKEIPYTDLVRLYTKEHQSIESLARQYHVSPGTIVNRLHDYGIRSKRIVPLSSVPVERVVRAYESGNSTTSIANMMGITKWKVLHILRRQGITIRGHRRHYHPIQEMAYLYTTHHMSTKDISIAYGLQANTISLYLREYGISMRSRRMEIDEDRIRSLHGEGLSIAAIAQKMDCSVSAVRSRLKQKSL